MHILSSKLTFFWVKSSISFHLVVCKISNAQFLISYSQYQSHTADMKGIMDKQKLAKKVYTKCIPYLIYGGNTPDTEKKKRKPRPSTSSTS